MKQVLIILSVVASSHPSVQDVARVSILGLTTLAPTVDFANQRSVYS
jgi:hypothetical protein